MPNGEDKNLNPLNKDLQNYDADLNNAIDIFAKPDSKKYTEGIDIDMAQYERAKKTGSVAGDLLTPGAFTKDTGRFNKLIQEEDRLLTDKKAREQSTADKIGNGLVKFGGRVFTSVAGSTIGTLYGLYSWARDGEFRSFFDNEFQDGLDGINDYLAEEFPHYYTSTTDDWEVQNFIFDKVFDGLGFAVGAVGSGMLGGAATNALTKSLGWSKYLKAGAVNKLNKTLTNVQSSSDDILKATEQFGRSIRRIDRASQIPNTIASMTTGAVYESGVEARHTFDEIKEELINSYKAEFGKVPTGQQLEEINKIAGESANGVFAANMVLVGGSNIMQFGKHLGVDVGDLKKLFKNKTIAKQTTSGEFTTTGSRIARGAKTILEKPLTESQEEMLQSVISNTGKEYAQKKYSNDGRADLTDLIDSSIKSFKGVYSSKEGWEEGLLGAIIGSIGVYNARKDTDGKRNMPSLAIIESVKDFRKDEQFRNSIVQLLNDNDVTSSLTSALEHTLRDGQLERAKDGAIALNKPMEYKNAEDEQFHSYVTSRIKAGMISAVKEDLNQLRNTPIEEFKETFGISPEVEYTEVDKLKQIESFERRVKDIEESTKYVESTYPQLEDHYDELIFDHAMMQRISDRRETISRQIEELTGNAAITLNVTEEGTEVPASAKEIFKDVDNKYKVNEKAYTDLYKDYIELGKKQAAHLENFRKVTSDPKEREAREQEKETVQKEASKKANKNKRKKEKTQAKEKEAGRAAISDEIEANEQLDILDNDKIIADEQAALDEIDGLEVVDPGTELAKEALAKDKDARENVNEVLKNKQADPSGINPETPSDERTDYKRDQEINEKSDDTKVAPKDYTKDNKTKINAETEIANANRGKVTEGYQNEKVQKEATGVYRIGKRLVYAYNAIAVRTRNFIETSTGIKESSDKIDTKTSLDILHPELIKAGDKVEITLNAEEGFVFYNPDGTINEEKRNEVGTINQIMEVRANGALIGYIHGLDFITENRVVPIVDGKNNIESNRKALEEIRTTIFNHLQDDQVYQATVQSKSAGQIRVKTNEKYDSPLTETIAEDTRPQILVVKDGTIYHNNQPVSDSWLGKELLFDIESAYQGEVPFVERFNGATLIAVPGANGKFIVSMVRNGSLSESKLPIADTVIELLDSFINQDVEKLAEYGLADIESGEIYDELVSEYINKFIYTNAKLDNPYYMYLGMSDNNMPQIAFKDSEGNALVYTGNVESTARKKLLDRVSNSLISTNLRELTNEGSIRLIDGTTMSYKDFLYDNLYANFVGEQVKTSKGEVRSYTDNPIISLAFDDNYVKFGKKRPAKKDRPSEEVLLNSVTNIKQTSTNQEKVDDIERRREKELNPKIGDIVDGKEIVKLGKSRKGVPQISYKKKEEFNYEKVKKEAINQIYQRHRSEVDSNITDEELEDLYFAEMEKYISEQRAAFESSTGKIIGVTKESWQKDINQKYDAELAALEAKSQTSVKEVKEVSKDNPFLKSNFKRSKKSPKRNYKPKDLFKNLNPIIDADKGTLLPTKHVNDIVMSLVNTAYNILEEAEDKTISSVFKQLTSGLVEFKDYYESIDDTNGVKSVETVLNNMNAFKPLVAQRLRDLGLIIKNGKVSEVLFNAEEREEVFTEVEEDVLYGDAPDVSKSFKEDAVFGENPIDKLSHQIKLALATIPNEEANILGMDSYYDMETVYNSILEVLADKPDMTIDEMVEELKANAKKKPYLEYVAVDLLENSETPLAVKYQFNSHFKMAYLEKELAKADGTNNIKVLKSNRVALSNIVFEDWLNNGMLTNLFTNEEIVNKDYIQNVVQPKWNKALKSKSVTDTKTFLDSVGVIVSVEALEELKANSKNIPDFKIVWDSLFTHDNRGVFKKIREALNKEVPDGSHPLAEGGFVKKLARLEAEFREDIATKSSKDVEGNSIFSYIVPTYITDRFKRLKNKYGEVDQNYIKHLKSIPFLSRSWYLTMLETGTTKGSQKFRDVFDISVVDSLKVEGTEGKKFNKLTKKEQIIGQIAYFVNGYQGNNDGRISKFFVAKSDKSVLHILTALKHNVSSTPAEIRSNKWSEADKRQILDNIIGSEYSRIRDAQERSENHFLKTLDETGKGEFLFDDIKGYKPELFYTFPELNDLKEIRDEFGDLIKFEDAREVMWQTILPTLEAIHNDTKSELSKYGIIDGNSLNYVDSNYKDNNFKGDVDYFVRDYTLNYMLATFNYSQLFQGDVATAFKTDVEGSYANMFKRLAKDMAPAVRSATSIDPEYNEYKQIVLADSFNSSNNLEQLKELFGVDSSTVDEYTKIEGTDAQEVTLLSEHINVMYHHGKLTDEQYNRFYPTAKRGGEYNPEDLAELINILKNPHKPVYVENKYMADYGAEIPIYIKTSSFPLIPQLVKGTEFGKLEKIMRDNNISRAAFVSGVKLGAFKTIDAWEKALDKDGKETKFTTGKFNEKAIKDAIEKEGAVLNLNRRYFGIQQDVPFDANKKEILEGTQLMKLIQAGIEDVEILKEFNQLHIDIVNKQFDNLLDELEVTDNGDGTYSGVNLKKLRTLLREELIERGNYNENDLAALELKEVDSNGTLEFSIPLWANPKSAQFESLLNSIINKRVLRSKMPGKSYVLGTEEGWLGNSTEIEKVDSRDLQGTRYNPAKGLKPQRKGYENKETGEKVEKSYIDNYIKDNNDISKISKKEYNKLFEKTYKELGFKEVIFPAQVLMARGNYKGKQVVGYRIPTQGLNSMSAMEIVGYLPDYMGDLIIAPKDFTKQMGSDFDIDKLFVHRWHETRAGFKVSEQSVHTGWEWDQEKREKRFLKKDVLRTIDQKIIDMFNNASIKMNGEKFAVEVNADDLNEYYDKIVTKTLTEEDYKAIYDKKIKQNRIMTIYWETLTNPNNLKDILKPLDFGNLPEVVKDLPAVEQQHQLSPLRQIENYQNGNAGKFGVGVTSLASTTNALLQVETADLGIRMKDGFAFTINGEPKVVKSFKGKKTLDGNMTKADVISAFQSASVDNIKELLINRINYNRHTNDAFLTLSYLGLDDKYISYFLSQPIIKDFVSNKEALLSDFEQTSPTEVDDLALINTLAQYGNNPNEATKLWNKAFSESQLKTAVNKPEDFETQTALLAKFIELSKVGKEINNVIRALQPATSGIGKNRVAADTKQARVPEVLNSKLLYGVDSLLGNVQTTLDKNDNKIIDPNTIAGQGYEILRKSNNLFNSLYPINTVGKKMAEAIAEINNSDSKYFSEKQFTQMTKFAKSYLFAASLNLYGEENAKEYRDRLMVGSNSLAHRWEAYKKENPKNYLSQVIRTKLSKKADGVSTIYYNAATVDRTDDIKNVTSLLDMLSSGTPLEIELAEDTIAYAYLTGGNQDANSILKFIPNDYLSMVNLGSEVNSLAKGIVKGEIELMPIVKQFLQHYPYFVATTEEVSINEDGKLILSPDTASPSQFISVMDEKFKLYELTTELDQNGYVYKPVDNLGTYLYSEADFGNKNATSINPINQVNKIEVKDTGLEVTPKVSLTDVTVSNKVATTNDNIAKYKIGENSAKSTLEVIADRGVTEEYKSLAKALYETIGNDITIEIDESGELDKAGANGSFRGTKIKLNKSMKDPATFERVVLHETMHAVLSNIIANPTTKEQKSIIDSLQAVLKRAQKSRDKFSDKNGLANLDEFISELMTDYKFQQELATVDFNKDISLLNRIWNIVKDFLETLTGEKVTQSAIESVGELIQTLPKIESSVSVNAQKVLNESNISEYKGIKIVYTEDITTGEKTKGAAKFDRKNNTILINDKLLYEKYRQKAWTNPRKLIETIHGETIESSAKPLSENQFKTYQEFKDFVLEHEYQHTQLSREDFLKDNPNTTKGQYEDEINRKALSILKTNIIESRKKIAADILMERALTNTSINNETPNILDIDAPILGNTYQIKLNASELKELNNLLEIKNKISKDSYKKQYKEFAENVAQRLYAEDEIENEELFSPIKNSIFDSLPKEELDDYQKRCN